jgi:hypothetical protein
MSRYLSLIRARSYERNEKDEISLLKPEDNSLNSFLSYPQTQANHLPTVPSDHSGVEADLLSGRAVLIVECAHLDGEEVCFAADDILLDLDAQGRYRGRVVYRVSELKEIRAARPSPETLRTIHEAKKWIGGIYCGLAAD